jgi:hypothetical protein
MRTPTDIRSAFEAFADRAPTEVTLLLDEPAPTRRSSWRPVAAAVVAVAAVVALVAALAVTFAPHRRAAPAGIPPDRVPMQFSFTVATPTGYRYIGGTIVDGVQVGDFEGDPEGRTLHVFPPGRFDPTAAMKGAKVDVNGHRGYFADLSEPLGVTGYSIAWEYAPGAWAVVGSSQELPEVRQPELVFARAVRFGVRPLQVPFRLGYLPPGLAVTRGYEQRGPLPGAQELSFSDGMHDDVLRVDAGVEGNWFAHCQRLVIDGYPGCFGRPDSSSDHDRALRLKVPGGWLTIERFSSDYSDAELRKIAESLTLAPIDQPATWFDADTAIPR